MVKPGSYKFTTGVERFTNSRGARHAERLKEQLHKKKLTGTHFIRTANWKNIESKTDDRYYVDPDQLPFTAATAKEGFDILVKLHKDTFAHDGVAIQLFTTEGERVEEELGTLYPQRGDKPTLQCVTVHNSLYNDVVASIRQCGVGFTYSKHAMKREIRNYESEPHEFLRGLPLRKLVNSRALQGLIATGGAVAKISGRLAPLLKDLRAKGLTFEQATRQAVIEYHVSQGRAREHVKGCQRPLANCGLCHKRENPNNRFKCCAGCKMVYYCCRECQVKQWDNHKSFCKKNRN
jgi:hypothetical protein